MAQNRSDAYAAPMRTPFSCLERQGQPTASAGVVQLLIDSLVISSGVGSGSIQSRCLLGN